MSSKDVLEFKGGTVTMMTLHLLSADLEQVETYLKEKVEQAPRFFNQAPVIIDFGQIQQDSLEDVPQLLQVVKDCHLVPIAARTRNEGYREAIQAAGLPVLRQSEEDSDLNDQTDSEVKNGEAAPMDDRVQIEESETGLTLSRPVRSGQQVYSRQGDLVVVGACSPGAELVADGNIHVYGPLRGRAICGINGNERARIFCRSLEAELVSVAGIFRVLDDIPEEYHRRPVQIWLDGEALRIEALD